MVDVIGTRPTTSSAHVGSETRLVRFLPVNKKTTPKRGFS